MKYRNTPEALLYSHMTSQVPLKDLLTGKLPYYWHTTVIYAHSKRQGNDSVCLCATTLLRLLLPGLLKNDT